jgi:hypothetical protein
MGWVIAETALDAVLVTTVPAGEVINETAARRAVP